MPAAAVIPAPIAYIKVVAVKKLVVEPVGKGHGPKCFGPDCLLPSLSGTCGALGCLAGDAHHLL